MIFVTAVTPSTVAPRRESTAGQVLEVGHTPEKGPRLGVAPRAYPGLHGRAAGPRGATHPGHHGRGRGPPGAAFTVMPRVTPGGPDLPLIETS